MKLTPMLQELQMAAIATRHNDASSADFARYDRAIAEMARAYGFNTVEDDEINALIDLLDRDHPGWRGYLVGTVTAKEAA